MVTVPQEELQIVVFNYRRINAREIKDIDCCLDGDSILMEYSNPIYGVILSQTGCDQQMVTKIISIAQEAVKQYCMDNPPPLGGNGTTTQIDKTEVGHKQKAHKGRPSTVMSDVFGAIDQESGHLVVVPFFKAKKDGEHRFGPAKTAEVIPLVTRFIKRGGWIVSDKLCAYKHISLDHSEGEFSHAFDPIHTD